VCRNAFDALGGGDTSYLETDAYLEEHGAGNAPEQARVTDCLKGAANYALSIRSERQISGDRHEVVNWKCAYTCVFHVGGTGPCEFMDRPNAVVGF